MAAGELMATELGAAYLQSLTALKLDVKWVKVTVADRIPAVAKGTVDLECGSTTASLSRQEQVDFSLMTFIDGGSLLVTDASGIERK